MGIFDLFGGGKQDTMRQTTAQTMAFLLAQNERFEWFMRQKVAELETVVLQQEARAGPVEPVAAGPDGLAEAADEPVASPDNIRFALDDEPDDSSGGFLLDSEATPAAEPVPEPPDWQAMLGTPPSEPVVEPDESVQSDESDSSPGFDLAGPEPDESEGWETDLSGRGEAGDWS